MRFAAEFIGRTYEDFLRDHRVLVEANLRCAETFGMDQLSLISDPVRETEGFGGTTLYQKDSVPVCKGPLEEEDELDPSGLVVPDPYVSPRMRDRVDGVKLMRERAGDQYSVLGWVEGPTAEACDLRGMANFFMDMLEEPEACADLLDLTRDAALRFALAQLEAGADSIGIGEAVASQVSAETYRELCLPRLQQLVQAIQQAGGVVKLHICGNITHLLPDLASLGVDILDLDHMVELSTARKIMGPDTVLCTHLNPAGILQSGTPEEIRKAVREDVEVLGMPCMINAGCEIPFGTPPEHLEALCEPVRL
jgi:MtaA/CmuA family methyltransferase